MANQRKEGKMKVGVWLMPDEIGKLKEAAKACGMNVTDFIKASFLKTSKTKDETNENKSDS